MLPAAGVRGAAITRTAGRYFERLVSHDATFRVLQHLRIYTFSKLLPLSPASLARYQQGELLNRIVAGRRHAGPSLFARHLPAGRRFCSDYDCHPGA
ncbi:transport ATP-binding protein CydC [Salmonella enterica subsp. enterica]|uniref:Transport ATP-binding protein CydC n=1 Tax=Salmonella enterica I TaxID=59201 RepID=A0A3S4IMF9_SALET|nr:transport ATP-binding protein CydC [Salmonella enterica subsp. enterica]